MRRIAKNKSNSGKQTKRGFFWLRGLAIAALTGILAGVITLGAILQIGSKALPSPADTIIVLGARVYQDSPSLALKARLDTAFSLYTEGLAPLVIVSGGQGEDEPTTEALAMEQYLVERGVSGQVIIREEQSYSTLDNLRNSLSLMKELGLENALVVTSDYHVLRVGLIARHLGMNVSIAPAPLPVRPQLRLKMVAREVLAVWKDLFLLPWRNK